MTTRIASGVGANLLGQHSAERNQDATAYVGSLDAQRYEIVNGVVEVEGATNETTAEEGDEKATKEKGVPKFRLTAMKNREVLAEEKHPSSQTNKELLHLEHKQPSSSQDALLVLKHRRKSQEEGKVPKFEGLPFTLLPPKSQVLGKVKDFLGVISEANKNLQLNAKDKPEEYDIEVLNGNESEYIEMDLMLGVADLHTSEAVEAAEAAVAGNQPIFDLVGDANSSDSESSSDDDDDEDESNGDDNSNQHGKTRSKERPKSKRPKIVELS